MIGSFVTSKAGHDKGRLYVVLAEMKDSVLLADGRLKTVASPKKKKKRQRYRIKAKAKLRRDNIRENREIQKRSRNSVFLYINNKKLHPPEGAGNFCK